jgi:hypothetical protein
MAFEDCFGVRGRQHHEDLVAIPAEILELVQVRTGERTTAADQAGYQFCTLMHGLIVSGTGEHKVVAVCA